MKKSIIALLLAVLPGLALAAPADVDLDKAQIDLRDQASLQRGAKLFMNYCLTCHSADYARYNRMGRDIGLTDQQVAENLMFTTDSVFDTMSIAMSPRDAAKWFGTTPPDLSVIARSHGTDWLYSYLRGFYVDESRPFGFNNRVFPDVGMPHVLWELEGLKKPVYTTVTGPNGEAELVLTGFEQVTEGTMTPREFDQAARDLTNFLAYLGEPIQLERQALGWKVLAFLAFFLVFAYLLKREYWKDVH